ncbi:hypothetical protein A3J91_03335 [Candidatus Peribacteria bacterium RIFOXYC2_FULL_58_10]|nr:MAG: hypothetical protein A3J91_03335 [Candidatus Peribacteria bacterium RIFOXYC2_FULL_58_10]
MNIHQFQEGFLALASIPEDQADRARTIAEGLDDGQRDEFLGKLRTVNDQLQPSGGQLEQLFSEMERLISRTERAIDGTERSEQEQDERSLDIQKAEQHLSQSAS